MNHTTIGALAVTLLIILVIGTISAFGGLFLPASSTSGQSSTQATQISTGGLSSLTTHSLTNSTSAVKAAAVTSTSAAKPESTTSSATSTTSSTSSSTSSSSSSITTSSSTSTTTSSTSSTSTTSTTSTSSTTSTTTTPPPPRYALQVTAELPDGTVLKGLTAVIAPSGQPAPSVFLPASVTVTSGSSYTIELNQKKGFTFTRWSSGGTSASITIVVLQNTSLVAFYKPIAAQTLSVIGKLLNGKSVVGTSIDIISGQGGAKTTDTMPLNITATYGASYTIVAKSTAAVVFKYWDNPLLTNASHTVTLNDNLTITAYFQAMPYPHKLSGHGNHTITVVAHTKDGGLVVGAYFQVRINGQWNRVADGFTPGSVTVPDGTDEVVMYHCAQVSNLCWDKFFVYRHYNNTTPNVYTRWQYLTVQSDMTIHSYYEVIPASEAVHVTIEAEDSSTHAPIFVNCTCGAPIYIYAMNGTLIAQSLEPYSFWLWRGQVYTVTVGDLQGYWFAGWTTGTAGNSVTFTANPQPGTYDPYYQFFAALYRKQ